MKLHKKRRIAFFALILVICTACIGITISIQMNKYYKKQIEIQNRNENSELLGLDQELFKNKFINSFNNSIGEYDNTRVKKIDINKQIIYSKTIKEKIDSGYDINANIPIINIDSEDIKRYNDEINKIFETKINDIKKGNVNTIYSIDYMASINNNILSLVIKATLKEGNNSQRIILKTYNYDIERDEQVELKKIISAKGLKDKEIESKLKEEIQKQNKEAEKLQKLGYDVFIRDITDEMFEIENVNTFFIDTEGYIYVIYAYGNNNLTTEMDIIVF